MELSHNWYVVRILEGTANSVMTADKYYKDAYRNYRHFLRMYPENHYELIPEENLDKYFEMVQ